MNLITVVGLFVPSKSPFSSGSSGRILRIRISCLDKPWKERFCTAFELWDCTRKENEALGKTLKKMPSRQIRMACRKRSLDSERVSLLWSSGARHIMDSHGWRALLARRWGCHVEALSLTTTSPSLFKGGRKRC